MYNYVKNYDLRSVISDLINCFEEIDKVYLFGSRIYKYHAIDSDIDLLAITSYFKVPVLTKNFMNFQNKYSYIDLFFANEYGAYNFNNNFFLKNGSYETMIKNLGVILLWSHSEGYSNMVGKWIFPCNHAKKCIKTGPR